MYLNIASIALAAMAGSSSARHDLAQKPEPDHDFTVHRVQMPSKLMKLERRLLVHLPRGHAESKERSPVLYLPVSDGHRFHYAAGVVSLLERRKLTPGIIVVGIRDIDGRRDLTPTEIGGGPGPSGGAKIFMRHIAEEIVPFVEKRFSAGSRRLFWGHSIVGAFGVYCGLERPELFEGILVSSPWLIYDGSARFLFKVAPALLKQPCKTHRFFFVTCGKEPRLEAPIEEFVEILQNPAWKDVDCRHRLLPDATHDSSMIPTLPEGLRAFFEAE